MNGLKLLALYFKNYLSQKIEKLYSRLTYLLAMKSTYKNWYKILVVYFLKNESSIKLFDNLGNEKEFKFSSENLLTIVRLSKLLRKIGDYEISENGILIKFFGKEKNFKINDILEGNGFLELHNFYLMQTFKMEPKAIDENCYLVEFEGIKWKIRIHSHDIIAGPLLPYIYKPYEYKQWFSKIISKNSVFVDVGSNVGGYTIRACNLGATVIAIEPDKENFSILEENVKMNNFNNVSIFNVAIGSKASYLPIFAPRGNYSTSTFSLIKGGILRDYVKVIPLDDLINSFNYKTIDLLKIGVGGFEMEILNSAIDTLKRTRYIMIEFVITNRGKILKILSTNEFEVIDMKKKSDNMYSFLFKRR